MTHKAVDGNDLLNAYNLGLTQTRGLKQCQRKTNTFEMLFQTHKTVDGDNQLNAYNLGLTQTRGLKQCQRKTNTFEMFLQFRQIKQLMVITYYTGTHADTRLETGVRERQTHSKCFSSSDS